ncbi:MAG: hypothetical protein Q7U98_13475 [Methylicorpusculum sp.]|uniref:hypothetical protein n=1 Tax=Methylicorpusculum sp. TaxID=2713644 RepID=UPI00271B76EC|nr:hypothetical protein [Methylicorpusculum sp.]MDO8842965.1 hypothetical protein [Methylicorpusculum sp.]MDO8940157.1 hypothetical protein [Methylicorpusculum sp.]MDP2179516.1 hypothetical protein [Methylicorpusculum sp.]MDP2202194.1 hypothetical protein [Methylicorpusculum sp.]MDP3529769.1 hypothetical protein [Methylicorpusculum sp.]
MTQGLQSIEESLQSELKDKKLSVHNEKKPAMIAGFYEENTEPIRPGVIQK